MTAQRPRNEVRHADYPRGFTSYTEVMCKAANRATALSSVLPNTEVPCERFVRDLLRAVS